MFVLVQKNNTIYPPESYFTGKPRIYLISVWYGWVVAVESWGCLDFPATISGTLSPFELVQTINETIFYLNLLATSLYFILHFAGVQSFW